MTRLLSMLVVAAMAVAALVLPRNEGPPVGDLAALDPADVMTCMVEEGSGRSTTLDVVSDLDAPGQVTLFAGGGTPAESRFQTGVSGSASIPVDQLAAVGTAGALVELPSPSSSVSIVVTGAAQLGHEVCHASSSLQTVIAGASTLSGETMRLHLMNPYAGEALVEVAVQSDAGLETAPQLGSMTIPTRSSVVVDVHQLLPGRETLTFTIEAVRGRVLASAFQGAQGDEAVWNAVPAAQDWFVPIPAGGGSEVVVATPLSAEVAYQLDVYGPEGLVEAVAEGVVPGGGSVTLDLSQFGVEAPLAARVISAQPVAAFLRSHTGERVAITSGSAVTANRWLLPGAGSTATGGGTLVVANPSLDDATLVVTSLRDQSVALELTVAAGQVVELAGFEGRGRGYVVDAGEPVVAMWNTTEGAAGAFAIGMPVLDG